MVIHRKIEDLPAISYKVYGLLNQPLSAGVI